MNSKLFVLIKNKSFITGFIFGMFITTIATVVVVSFYSAPPNPNHLKGTMSGWAPVVGMIGTVSKCMELRPDRVRSIQITYVLWDNIPSLSLMRTISCVWGIQIIQWAKRS